MNRIISDVLSFIAGLAVGFAMGHSIWGQDYKHGAIAAYKHEIVCADVKQLDRPNEWQCVEVKGE